MPRTREPAQVVVLFALAILALVAFAGLAVDGGMVYVQRRTAQASADAGALAGTRALRDATAANQVGAVSAAVLNQAQANTFGVVPTVSCAYFVDTSGSPLATIINGGGAACSGTPVSAIPSAASGVQVMVHIPFSAHLVTVIGISSLQVDAAATAQVGVLTGFDARNSPIIACGGGSGAALRLPHITPVVATSTPGVLAATPAALPTAGGSIATTLELLLATPPAGVPTPPAYVVNPAQDGHVYYLKGNDVQTSSANCGATSFMGGAADVQPTPYVKNTADGTDDIMWGTTGNHIPAIATRVASSGACAAGTGDASFEEGAPGCVMVLPIAYDDASGGAPGTRPLKIGAWGAFYVWCLRETSGCSVFAGQYLANWPMASGPSASTWTFGQKGSITTIRLTG